MADDVARGGGGRLGVDDCTGAAAAFSLLRVLRGGAVTERCDFSGEGEGDAELFVRGA